MLVFEFKTYGKPEQFAAIDEAIRTVQFIRNKCIRLWIDNPKIFIGGECQLKPDKLGGAESFPHA
jgi:transposase